MFRVFLIFIPIYISCMIHFIYSTKVVYDILEKTGDDIKENVILIFPLILAVVT